MTFEEKLERLKEIVEQLESPEPLELDTSLLLFEEGVGLVRSCRKLLEDAKVRVQIISQDENSMNDGESLFENENGVFDGFEEN